MNDEIRKLLAAHKAMLAAEDAHRELYSKEHRVASDDPDPEKYIRYKIKENQCCNVSIAARAVFQAACLALANRIADEQVEELERAHG